MDYERQSSFSREKNSSTTTANSAKSAKQRKSISAAAIAAAKHLLGVTKWNLHGEMANCQKNTHAAAQKLLQLATCVTSRRQETAK